VRCVVVSEDGTKCISGSSDATVKVWDIGQQRCIHSLTMHSDSVWSLAADARFETVFSAGWSHPPAYSFLVVTLVLCCVVRTICSDVGGSWLSTGVSLE
jgi:WD40 repeat protein